MRADVGGNLRGAAVHVAEHDEHLAEIRMALDQVRRPGQRAAGPRHPHAIDHSRLEPKAIAATVVGVDAASQNEPRRLRCEPSAAANVAAKVSRGQ